ncbi:NUDIX domain-containing protein [Paenibacillus flagellatus]|uniref:ADP-ribose pyrophosphatase n=1 Tax=Paenibacillus flagellatus TaxID=2211139 RepID=A0A2V5KBK8_9BACL|nr:NUDIX domain-containing protein [Paenibacillus flagellatus]PYI56941.1 ADP-ribose pyrophosphatase [Paenibacillus flagellatus]
MILLGELTEDAIGIHADRGREAGEAIVSDMRYRVRKAARAVVFDLSGRIALLYAEKDRYHKLPGGGIEPGETVVEALRRELLEETGSQIEVLREIGAVIEYRDKQQLLQLSYGYVVQAVGGHVLPTWTDEERNDGMALLWTDAAEAIRLLGNDRPASYTGKFIRERDLLLLQNL